MTATNLTKKAVSSLFSAIVAASIILEAASEEASSSITLVQGWENEPPNGGTIARMEEVSSVEPVGQAAEIFDPDDMTSADEGADMATISFPALSDLIEEESRDVTGDVSWLLDFAVIGNSKCGTTFLMHWLAKHPETMLDVKEICALSRDDPAELVSRHYEDVDVASNGKYQRNEEGRVILKGLKCPRDISTEFALENYAKYFPDTKFIVSVRHPVRWFESFYNFQAYNLYPESLPPTEDLIGACVPGSPYACAHDCNDGNHNVCTDRANFHHYLSRLGKTDMNTPEETKLLVHDMNVIPVRGKVFLMDIAQLNATDEAASGHLAADLRDFLGLGSDLKALHERKTGKESHQHSDPERRRASMIDICDEEHSAVRAMLVRNGKEAMSWIRDYFLRSPDVVVSSRERFVEIIEEWGSDPCEL